MGKLSFGKVWDCLCLSSGSSSSCFCLNSLENEDYVFEKRPLIASDKGQVLRMKDVVSDTQTLAFQLKPKVSSRFYLYSNLRSNPSFDCQWVNVYSKFGVFQYNMVGFFIFFFKWLRTCESLFQYSQVSIVRSNPSQWKFEILWFLMFRWWC